MDKIKDVANMVDGTNHRIFWFENNVSNIMFKYPFNMSYVLILIPTILLFASVYYRIKEKEIK